MALKKTFSESWAWSAKLTLSHQKDPLLEKVKLLARRRKKSKINTLQKEKD